MADYSTILLAADSLIVPSIDRGVGMIDSIGAAQQAARPQQGDTNSQLVTAMLKKQKQVTEEQGQMAIELLNSVPKPHGALGQNVDVKV
ncbi:YjfB family protein [endosymbiont of Ridgeia piscesae]|nr:YjfB family protein [endosymbiont of Ridgeia piscesae]EGV50171.1 hypothetical protein Rifp1Sym_dw00020 [endosymbiont of Riftia pachyptila (vent Ph05)]